MQKRKKKTSPSPNVCPCMHKLGVWCRGSKDTVLNEEKQKKTKYIRKLKLKRVFPVFSGENSEKQSSNESMVGGPMLARGERDARFFFFILLLI